MLMTLTTAPRHSTRLETLGRTVKQYIHIPHTLSSLSSLSLSQAPGGSTSSKSARPVSFGHYSLSGLQAPRFGQLLDEDGDLPIENDHDDIIHAAWYNAHGRWVPIHFASNVIPADSILPYVAQYASLGYLL